MRNITLLLILLLSLNAKAQRLDTSISTITAVVIEPILPKFTDSVPATRLGVRIISDDLKTACQLYYELLDSTAKVMFKGNMIIDGEAYHEWDGRNEFPFQFVADKLGLEIKLD